MRNIATTVIVLTLAAVAAGQDPVPRGGGWGGPGGNWGPRQWINQMLEGFDKELSFSAQQWEQFDPIVTAQVTRAQEAQSRWREVGEAMAAGEEARTAELQKQLQQEFNESEGGMRDLFDDIEAVLDEEQLNRFGEMRNVMQQWRDHGSQMWQAVRELPDAVKMTDEQREDYHALLGQRWQEMQEEMRQRAEDGIASMWDAPDFAALRDDFYGQVSALLDPEQQQLVDEYRKQFTKAEEVSGKERTYDVREVLRAMKRVRNLSSEQRETLRQIEQEAGDSYHALRHDKAQQAQLAAAVRAEIIKVLDAEQAEEFNRYLDRGRSRRGQEKRD